VGVFERNRVAGIDQNADHQIECLLRSVDDDHLFRLAHHRTRTAQVRADGRTQFCIA
jgi:hypothetical protein